MFRSRRVIQNRLDKLQLDRVETAADGSCQFVALTLSADIAMDAFAFRTQVVGYLRSTATLFKNDVDKSFPSFEAYLDCMARLQSWGDDLTLAAASHLLLRRIRVVSDHDLEVERFSVRQPLSQKRSGAATSPYVTSCRITTKPLARRAGARRGSCETRRKTQIAIGSKPFQGCPAKNSLNLKSSCWRCSGFLVEGLAFGVKLFL